MGLGCLCADVDRHRNEKAHVLCKSSSAINLIPVKKSSVL